MDVCEMNKEELLATKGEIEERLSEVKQEEEEKGVAKIIKSAKFKNAIASLDNQTEKVTLNITFDLTSYGTLDAYADEYLIVDHSIDNIKTNSKDASINSYIEDNINQACSDIGALSKTFVKQQKSAGELMDMFNHIDVDEAVQIIEEAMRG